MNYRDQLLRQVRLENKTDLRGFYNKFRKRLEKKLFHAKQDFFQKKMERAKNNSKATWKLINEITCRKKNHHSRKL